MNELFNDIKVEQLSYLIERDKVNESNYLLLKYIFDIVISDYNQSNSKTEILEILQIAFYSLRKNENEFIYEYINYI